MKKFAIALTATLFLFSCKQNSGNSADQQIRKENFYLKKENDSLKSVLEKSQRTYEGDTIQKLPEEPQIQAYPTFPGKHALTLQWVSWQQPGSVNIKPSDNGWYTIEGSQSNPEGNYVKINGRIKPLNNRELEFDGKIETRVDHINGGEPCIRTGTKIFKATGTRKYWRLQDMINCEGGMVTDYVDIYF